MGLYEIHITLLLWKDSRGAVQETFLGYLELKRLRRFFC